MKSFSSFKSIDEQINEVLSKDASAGDWISDFIKSDNPKFAGKSKEKRKEMALAAYYAKQRNEAVVQPNGTDKIQPDEGMCEGLCQVCGATDCKEHFYKSPAVTGYVKESTPYYNKPSFLKKMGRVAKQERLAREKKEAEQKQVKEATVDTADIEKNKVISNKDKNTLSKLATLMAKQKKSIKEESGEHHDYAHVKKTMKKVDYDAYAKHMSKHDADHSMENKHKVDTQHSGSYTGKIHGAEVSHKVSGSGQKEYYIKEETLDELSKDTLKSYIGKAVKDVAEKKRQQQIALNRSKQDRLKDHTKQSNIDQSNRIGDEAKKRASNIGKAAMKYAESTEVEESRGHKILATAMANAERMKTVQIPTPAERRAELEKQNKEKQMKESADKKPYIVISHVSDNTGARADGEKVEKQRVATKLIATSPEHALQLSKAHHTKAGRKVHSASIKEEVVVEAVDTVKKDASGKVIAWSHEGDWEKNSKKKQGTGKAANLAGQALQKTKSLNKEEVELEESWEVYDTKTRAIHSSHPTQRKALNAMNKLNDKHPGYETPGNLIASKFGARVSKAVKEEVQIDEAAWGKDKATNLRQAHDRHMEKALAANKAGDDEAVKTHQRKMQMIQGKLQKLKNNEEVELGEECEILSELSKATLGSYVKKASEQGKKAAVSAGQSGQGLGIALASGNQHLAKVHDDNIIYSNKLEKKRKEGVSKAVDKLTKEDTMVTYKEFMASIEEGRIDDLKDKLAADREKRLNKMDYSKEKEAAKNPVTKVKGHSYGAGDEEGEAETAKPAEPAEKRGRGRPAGSKSGARA